MLYILTEVFMKKIMYILPILLLFSCNKEEEATSSNSSSSAVVEVSGVGATKFGKVPVGDVKFGGIKIFNPTGSPVGISISGETAEIKADQLNGCLNNTVAPNSTCTIIVKFAPQSRGLYTAKINVGSGSVVFTGQGLENGRLVVSPTSWSIASQFAGQAITQDFTLTNDGDTTIDVPEVTGVEFFERTFSNCGESIRSGKSCKITLKSQKVEAATHIETIRLKSSDIIFADVIYSSVVLPKTPSGIILFDNVPSAIVSDGADIQTIDLVSITDEFGNAVANNTIVNLSGTNITFPDGNTILTTNGKSSFRIQSTLVKGEAIISASSDQATGFISIKSASGPPVGTILAEPFNPNVRANGVASVTIKTQPILDSNGNKVNDGTPVKLSLSNSGTLLNVDTVTFKGVAFATITAGNIAEGTTLTIQAGPVFDGNGDITGYGATGSFVVNFISNAPQGTFSINSEHDAIFYSKDGTDFEEVSEISIGPITDSFSNPVGAGHTVGVVLTNGVADSVSPGNSVFNVTTDADSIARFDLKGIGVRAFINIEATSGGETVSTTVFATGLEYYTHTQFGSKLVLYKSYFPSVFSTTTSALPGSTSWHKYLEDLSGTTDNNFVHVGGRTFSNLAKEIDYNFPRIIWDCWQNVKASVMLGSCGYTKDVAGTKFFASSNGYVIRSERGITPVKAGSVGSKIGSAAANGVQEVVYPTIVYDDKLDTMLVSGGLKLSPVPNFVSSPLINTSAYKFPSTIRTNFDSMNYSKTGAVHSDASFYTSSVSILGKESYVFGGVVAPLSNVTASNTLYKVISDVDVANDTGTILEEVTVADDPIFGAPRPRYQAGMLYRISDESIYIIGGQTYDELGEVWLFTDDVWKVSTTAGTPTWDQVCSGCGLPNLHVDFDSIFNLISSPSGANFSRFVSIPATSKKIHTVQDRTRKKNYLFYENHTDIYEINLDTGNVAISSDSHLSNLNLAFQTLYNPISNRYYSFKLGAQDQEDSKMWYFETEPGTKQYYRASFDMPTEAKSFAKQIKILVSGYAEAATMRDPKVNDFGLSVYIYNYTDSRYDIVGTTSVNNQLDTKDNPVSKTLLAIDNPSEYISGSNKLDLVIFPTFNPGFQGTGSSPIDGYSDLFLNHVSIEGIW
jgi:hypothetical protein